MGDLEELHRSQLCALCKNNWVKLNVASNFKPFIFSGRKSGGLTEKNTGVPDIPKEGHASQRKQSTYSCRTSMECNINIYNESLSYVTNFT